MGEVVYLLCALLTDQKVLLHATDPSVLLPAAQALRALMVPLTYSSLYIPYLPATLLRPSDAITLLNDSTQPYLIGTHSSLLQTLVGNGEVLAPELVVADLDRAELRPCTAHDSFPANVAMLTAFAPPAATLLARLQACVSPERFDEVAVQAACMQFLADMLNLHDGALSDSKHTLTLT